MPCYMHLLGQSPEVFCMIQISMMNKLKKNRSILQVEGIENVR